ncbi:hypothetical protein FFZ77_32120 [Streptomyces katsurahamanus]|uniref:MFS transporter n=1 Tax=Streptomyces katsurahamanus TaxID=2577098 RepID=A0ABW9P3B0_9ACTN|nr:hypothetical protein [Streptomyces katsurahamanus]
MGPPPGGPAAGEAAGRPGGACGAAGAPGGGGGQADRSAGGACGGRTGAREARAGRVAAGPVHRKARCFLCLWQEFGDAFSYFRTTLLTHCIADATHGETIGGSM